MIATERGVGIRIPQYIKMLALRRPSVVLSSCLPTISRSQHINNANIIIRCNSKKTKILWPTEHPQKKQLNKLKDAISTNNNNKQSQSHAHNMKSNGGASNNKNISEPTNEQLKIVAMHQAIPFVGFGIMDNAILILAGETIDIYLGLTLGISTMCAAAIGNIISDVCGVAFGTVIEDALLSWSKKIESITKGRVKLPPMPQLSYEQRNLRSVRLSGQLGCALGLTVGCIIGMFPLLFFSSDKEKEVDDGEEEVNNKLINYQNNEHIMLEEIRNWKEKHTEVADRLKLLEKENMEIKSKIR